MGGLCFSHDSRRVAMSTFDRAVHIFDAVSERDISVLRGHSGIIDGLVFSPDGRRLASCGNEDKTVRIWDPVNGQEILTLRGHSFNCQGVAFSPDGNRIASAGADGTIRIWDASPVQPSEGVDYLTCRHEHEVWSVAWSPDGRQLASGSWDKTVRLWDPRTGALLQPALPHPDEVYRVAFSPDGRRLAAGVSFQQSGLTKVWDLVTRESLDVRQSDTWSFAASFDPEGRYLLKQGPAFTVDVFNAQTGLEVEALGKHEATVWAIVFSPDGHRLATASNDGAVKVWVWNPAGLGQPQRPEFTLQLHIRGFGDRVAFSADSQRLITGGEGHTVEIWDARTGHHDQSLRGHSGDVWSLAVDRAGRWIASAGEDTTIRLWDAKTFQPLHTLRGHQGVVSSLAFSPDGQVLASGSRDRTVKFWDMARVERHDQP